MAKKKNWLATELLYIALAPLLVLLGILIYGILFNDWQKDIILILRLSGMTYVAIVLLRILKWIINLFSK